MTYQEINTIVFEKIREAAALKLWQAGAVKVNLEEPFKLVSRNFSPIYINCRQVISDQTFMTLFCAGSRLLFEQNNIEPDAFAGGETAGIPYGAYLAQYFAKPMNYVRKAKKGYGLANLVEGIPPKDKEVILVEDLITNAGSKVHFIDVLKAVGGKVNHVLVLFDRLQGGKQALADIGIQLHSITDMNLALQVARNHKLFSGDDLDSVQAYLDDPQTWHKDRDLEFVKA